MCLLFSNDFVDQGCVATWKTKQKKWVRSYYPQLRNFGIRTTGISEAEHRLIKKNQQISTQATLAKLGNSEMDRQAKRRFQREIGHLRDLGNIMICFDLA